MKDEHDTGQRKTVDREYWLDVPGNADKVFWGLCILCGLLIVIEIPLKLLHLRHEHFAFDGWVAFFGVSGFVAFFVIVMAGKYLRKVLMRGEDYYDSPHRSPQGDGDPPGGRDG